MKWADRFREPDRKYRSLPFWSWNDRLREDEIRRQVREMARVGHGGFFMHARSGLLTEYMGDEWFSAVRAAADEAEKCGIRAWCYDELGWPSGSAGGAVTRTHPEHSVCWLRMRTPDDTGDAPCLGTFAIGGDGSYRKISDPAEAKDGERVLCAVYFTDESYIDVLDPEAVREFARQTHERYFSELPDLFDGGLIGGFFTDEPQYALCRVPWSKIARDEFYGRYGYDIADFIPALFFDVEGAEKVRFDYWEMVNDLYVESFAGTLASVCESRGVRLTGHAMMEDNMLCQMHCTGGVMPFYEYLHLPGIDWLGRDPARERTTGRMCMPVIPLQLGSVVSQLGRGGAISETYAMCGWDVSFREMKWLADWQIMYGVTVFCQHLEGYTIRGYRKTDYPPSVFYQSPWWDDYRLFTDTAAREGEIMGSGIWDPGVLVLHPIHSLRLNFNGTDINSEQAYDDEFNLAVLALSDAHVDFHFGDERILRRHGSAKGGRLTVGRNEYGTVILPSLYGLDRSTFDLLTEFVSGGGKLVSLGRLPDFIDGVPAADELAPLLAHAVRCEPEAGALSRLETGSRRVFVEGDGAEFIHCTERIYPEDGRRVIFLLNTTRDRSFDVTVTSAGRSAEELLPDVCESVPLSAEYADGSLSVRLKFSPMQSRILVITDGEAAAVPEKEEPAAIALPEIWRVGAESDPNVLMMENCRVRFPDGSCTEPDHVWLSKDALFGRYDPAACALEFDFTVDGDADLSRLAGARLVTELPTGVSVFLNGTALEPVPGEWWLDRCFPVYETRGAVRKGENVVSIRGLSSRDGDEPGFVYLLGDFGVFSKTAFTDGENRSTVTDGPFYVADRPLEISGENVVTQGYAFFRGRLVLEGKFKARAGAPCAVFLPDLHAALAKVRVNGGDAGTVVWGDMKTDVSEFVRDGDDDLVLELIIGNRNLLGPHHAKTPEPMGVGPDEMYPFNPSEMKKRYAFVRSGIK